MKIENIEEKIMRDFIWIHTNEYETKKIIIIKLRLVSYGAHALIDDST